MFYFFLIANIILELFHFDLVCLWQVCFVESYRISIHCMCNLKKILPKHMHYVCVCAREKKKLTDLFSIPTHMVRIYAYSSSCIIIYKHVTNFS